MKLLRNLEVASCAAPCLLAWGLDCGEAGEVVLFDDCAGHASREDWQGDAPSGGILRGLRSVTQYAFPC